MAENRLKICLYRILRSPLRSCKSKDQLSDVVSTHSPTEARLPLLSPEVNGRKCPPASPIISPLNTRSHNFPMQTEKGNKSKKKKANKKRFLYKKRAFEDRFPECKYVNGLFSSDDEDEEEAVAVVKRSRDPYSDFRSSMVEMIVEKNMFAAKDLENLLRCFLSLNSYHHHKVIVQVFAEIWEAFFFSNQLILS